MSVTMKVHGLRALNEQLAKLEAKLAAKALTEAALKAFAPVLEDARAYAQGSEDSGDLRESIKMTTPKGGPGVTVGLRIDKPALKRKGKLAPRSRWHFIEMGTAKHPAKPYLRPALDRNATKVVRLLRDLLGQEIRKVAAKAKRPRRR